jgi:hypothetical protein
LSIDVVEVCDRFNRNVRRNGAVKVSQRAARQWISTVTCAMAPEIRLQWAEIHPNVTTLGNSFTKESEGVCVN